MNDMTNLDAAEMIFFERELEFRKSKSYDILKAPLNAFMVFPVSTEVDAGAETIVYEQYDSYGMARIISNYADDLPRADVRGRQFTSMIQSVGNAYGWSIQELRASMRAGKALPERKQSAAIRAHRELWNKVAFYGDSVNGLQGILTNPNIPLNGAAAVGNINGGTNSPKWIHKTGQQILNDLNTLVHRMVTSTKSVEKPDTLVLPLLELTYISSTAWQTGGTDTTILEFFLKQQQYIKRVISITEFEGPEIVAAGLGGTFNGGVAMVYRNSPEVLTLEMPVMFEQFEIERRGLEYVVPCHSRIGGVIIYYPFAIAFMDDFTADAT